MGFDRFKPKKFNVNTLSTPTKILFYIMIEIAAFSIIRLVVYLLMRLLFQEGIAVFPTNFNEFDLLIAQISNTFIVLSLTSVLSTNMGTVYWIDIKDEKLVRPFFWCFYALTTYLLTSMVISIIEFFIQDLYGLCISFFMSIILLIFLTISMIDAHFNRNQIKNKYRWEYIMTNMMADDISNFRISSLRYLLDRGLVHSRKKCKADVSLFWKSEQEIEDGLKAMEERDGPLPESFKNEFRKLHKQEEKEPILPPQMVKNM